MLYTGEGANHSLTKLTREICKLTGLDPAKEKSQTQFFFVDNSENFEPSNFFG